MANDSVILTENNSGKQHQFPVLRGTIGPGAFDVTSLYKEAGMFTYDPGYMATASCHSSIVVIQSSNWQQRRAFWRWPICWSTASFPTRGN